MNEILVPGALYTYNELNFMDRIPCISDIDFVSKKYFYGLCDHNGLHRICNVAIYICSTKEEWILKNFRDQEVPVHFMYDVRGAFIYALSDASRMGDCLTLISM